MNKFHNIIFPVISGALFSLAWPAIADFPFLLFFAFVPLLFLEEKYYRQNEKSARSFFAYSYFAFFLWNATTTWWIYYSTFFGMLAAVICNSFFMAAVFYLFHLTRKKIGSKQGYIGLIVYWIAWEWWHLQWDLSWPWLTLGNGFANFPQWIQWYEYTGVFGGSLWILVVNILVFKLVASISTFQKSKTFGKFKYQIASIIFLILIPFFISFRIYNNYIENDDPINVAIVQPNDDPYNVKFDASPYELLEKMFEIAKPNLDSSVEYLVFPETALTEILWENVLDSAYSILFIKEFLKQFPQLKIVTGASTYYAFSENENLSPTARKFKKETGFFDAFNTALHIDSSNEILIYHKSKLVVGVEKMPYPSIFKPLESFAIDLGGTSGSLGMQEERKWQLAVGNRQSAKLSTANYQPPTNPFVAPVICYESIYGEFVTGYVKNGAEVIFIITNDGWWKNTAGHKQHLAYGRLRAIENRRSIARSANTGISCFINQRGDIFQPTKWWEQAFIKQKINKNSEITFYAAHGDFIARTALFIALFLLLWTIVKSFFKKQFGLN